MKIVFATHNLNKLKEVQALMPEGVSLLSLKDINCTEEILETAETLEGNAQLKANYISKHYQFDCFADDTGLEVDALGGLPGVYSARYAGEYADADQNMNKLLKALRFSRNRKAQFRTVIALNFKGQSHLFEGVCKGNILVTKSGTAGFGYDPIFKPKGYKKSFASMPLANKNKISHRAMAVCKLVDFFNKVT